MRDRVETRPSRRPLSPAGLWTAESSAVVPLVSGDQPLHDYTHDRKSYVMRGEGQESREKQSQNGGLYLLCSFKLLCLGG